MLLQKKAAQYEKRIKDLCGCAAPMVDDVTLASNIARQETAIARVRLSNELCSLLQALMWFGAAAYSGTRHTMAQWRETCCAALHRICQKRALLAMYTNARLYLLSGTCA